MITAIVKTALLCSLVSVAGCWSTPRPVAPRRDTHISLDVEQIELPNGLGVVVVPEPASAEVSVTMRYGVGASDDPTGQEGLAHLVEHLMFEHVRGDEALFDYLEAHTLGFNGYTTLDSTVYTERAAPTQLGDLLELEAARAQEACAAIPASSFARQREIVRNELRERDDDVRVQAALRDAVFSKGHPFAGRLATAATVATITQDQACAFAAAHNGPANAVLVISGRVSLRDAGPLIARTIARIPRSDARPTRIASIARRRQDTVAAPVDRTWIVFAWPMPESPVARGRMRAVVRMATALVNSRVNGLVTTIEIGAGAARQIAIAVAPSTDISVPDALNGIRDALYRSGPWFGSGLYEHAQNLAIYRFVASLDHGIDRDLSLAEDVAAGVDARTSNGEVLNALRSMSRNDAEAIMRSALDTNAATIVTMSPSGHTTQSGGSLASVVREQRRRRAEDPADARRPAAAISPDSKPFASIHMRTLSNGLKVILLPFSTMPTVDIRIVFPAGTADEPTGQRGVAILVAQALYPHWDPDALRFAEAGGRVEDDVGFDHTALIVRGLTANLDVLLSGLSSTVREGTYDSESVRDAVAWQNMSSHTERSDRIANDVWRNAVYGENHPYRYAGQWRHADRAATSMDALTRFRTAHYNPNGATLIISGGFDPSDAERWIEYSFAEWNGVTARRPTTPAMLRPLAFAQARDTTQISVDVAFSISRTDRVASLIVAEMIDEAIADVRELLAASYGVHARMLETRLATTIELGGYVDAGRASEVFALLRDRLLRLRDSSDDTAALFVSARRRVLARLLSIDTKADALADLFVHYADLDADASLGASSAEEARLLTIDRIAPLLSKIDFSNAAILLRGPLPALKAAYAAIGRQPSLLE